MFSRDGQFSIDVPQGISQDDLSVSRSWDFVLFIENVWQAWNCSKSWCIPNYQLSVSFKNSSFLLPDFRRIRESLQIRNLMANCLRRRDQMVYSIFSKSCLSGHQGFQKISKWKKVFIEMGSLPTVITNSFRIPVFQKFENIFIHIFSFSFALRFFRSINKIHDDKRRLKQVYLFHTNANIKAKFTFFKKCIHKWKHS